MARLEEINGLCNGVLDAALTCASQYLTASGHTLPSQFGKELSMRDC